MAFPLEPTQVLGHLRLHLGKENLPPVTFNIARHVHSPPQSRAPRRKRLHPRHETPVPVTPIDADTLILTTEALLELVKERRFAISKLFARRPGDSDDSDIDDGLIRALDDDNNLVAVALLHDDATVKAHPLPRRRRVLDLLVVSDFGVLVDKDGRVVRKITSDDEFELAGEEENDDYDDGYDDDALLLLDSAFTDIDALLMMLLLMLPELFIDLGTFDYSKLRKKSSLRPLLRPLLKPLKEKLTVLLRKLTLTFEKMTPNDASTTSALSHMIQAKLKPTGHPHPLSYYAFVGEGALAMVTVFVPDHDRIEVQVNVNAAIADCIGYILWSLVRAEVPVSLINPNQWQLELVDEDGEDYGTFGLLNRTRIFSLYNNPPYVAIKQALAVDAATNETTTPLAMEYKVSLAALEKRQLQVTTKVDGEDRTLVRVLVAHDLNFIYVHPNATMGQVLKDFCAREQLDFNKYKLREIEMPVPNNRIALLLLPVPQGATQYGRILSDDALVGDLANNAVELMPIRNQYNSQITPGSSMQITPSNQVLESSALGHLAPPTPKQSGQRNGQGKPKPQIGQMGKGTSQAHRRTSTKFSLDEFFKQSEPTNILALWFKWRVWRKKPAMLNKIEKLLIIDGDYIHLAPGETPETFLLHDYHHLSHYHYTKFYKQMSNKTSSFHIAHLIKVKQNVKNPAALKIVVIKHVNNDVKDIEKKYYLEAENERQCKDIIDKLQLAQQVYNLSQLNT